MKQSSKQAYWNWFLLTLFYSYQYLVRVYPGTFTDEIRQTFSFSAHEFATLTTYCVCVYSSLQIPFGVLLDRVNMRWLILSSFGLCLIGQHMFTNSQTGAYAQWGRILVGIGSAPAFMAAVKVAADSFSDRIRGTFIGITCTIGVLCVIVGNSLLKQICLSTHSWQVASSYLTFAGCTLFLLCLLSLTSPKQSTEDEKPNDFWPTFFSVILNGRIFLYALLTVGTCSVVATLSDLWGSTFLAAKYQLSSIQAVFFNQFVFAGLMIGAFILPMIFNGKNTLKGVRICCVFLALLLCVLIYGPHKMPAVVLQGLLFVLGFLGCADILCYALTAQSSTPQTSGLIVGWVNTVNMLGLTLLEKLVASSLDDHWTGAVNDQGLRLYLASDYEVALGVLLNAVLVALCITYFMRKKSRS